MIWGTARGAIDELVRIETSLVSARAWLDRLAHYGIARESDYATYNALANEIYVFELALYNALTSTLRAGGIPDTVVGLIPVPQLASASLGQDQAAATLQSGAPVSTAGLGGRNPAYPSRRTMSIVTGSKRAMPGRIPEVTGGRVTMRSAQVDGLSGGLGAAKLAPVAWAVIILSIAVGGVVIYKFLDTLGVSVASGHRLLETASRLYTYLQTLRARSAMFESCMRGGRTMEQCREDVLRAVPDAPQGAPPPADPGGFPTWGIVLASVGGVALLAGGIYAYAIYKKPSGGSSGSSNMVRAGIG